MYCCKQDVFIKRENMTLNTVLASLKDKLALAPANLI